MSVSVVRRFAAPTTVLALAGLAAIGVLGCSSATTSAGIVSGVDSISTDATFTGTMFSGGNNFAFDDSAEVEVGDLDHESPGESMRGLLAFDLPTFANTTIKSAMLRVYQCAVFGTPYTSLGSVVADHVTLSGTPSSGMYTGQTITANIGTVSADLNVEYKYLDVTTSVQNDIANSRTVSTFRLHFSTADDNNNGVDDYADFNTAFTGDCAGNAAVAPLLIVSD